VKTVEEVIAILQTLPPKSRILVGDSFEGTIRDIEAIKINPTKYYKEHERNDSPIVELTVDHLDEYYDSWIEEHGEDPRMTRKPWKPTKHAEKEIKEIGFYTNIRTPKEMSDVYVFMKTNGYTLVGAEVCGEYDQREYRKEKRSITVRYYFELQDADFMAEPIYRWILSSPTIVSPGSCWLLDEDPIPYLKRMAI
jgi:hypothetical protein